MGVERLTHYLLDILKYCLKRFYQSNNVFFYFLITFAKHKHAIFTAVSCKE